MMSRLGEGAIYDLDKARYREDQTKQLQEIQQLQISRFIIEPNNFNKMQWDFFIALVFILWLFIAPIYISRHMNVHDDDRRQLFLFDIVFIADRFIDLFVGFFKPNGDQENKLYVVILNNISSKLFIEIAISCIPLLLNDIPGYQYALIKIFRYGRMYEIDAWIGEYLQYKAV